MTLLAAFLGIVRQWECVFPQRRSFERAVRQALGALVCLGRRTLSRIIWTNGGQNRGWAAEYFLHSRCRWDPQRLFEPQRPTKRRQYRESPAPAQQNICCPGHGSDSSEFHFLG